MMNPKRIVKIFTAALAALGVAAGVYAVAGSRMSESAMSMEKDRQGLDVATFAGGCFWCTESDFEKVKGVKEAVSGYTGGRTASPNYAEVSAGGTGHTEAVQVYYDPGVVSYDRLLDVFWRHINPTDPGGQFVDRGSQYRSEIFYHSDTQKELAEASKKDLEAAGVFDSPIVTPVTRFERFYPAEDYHQDYYKRNPLRYKYYRWGSGRDQFIEKTWKDHPVKAAGTSGAAMADAVDTADAAVWKRPGDPEIRARLTPLQYRVTQEDGTEPPFRNAFWDSKQEGIYVDIVSGEPLFSSTDKFKSGTGWPSFTRPLEPAHIVEKKDHSLFMVRVEVRSRYGNSHLGHVFDDGPAPTGLRYCINSAALRFIPRDRLTAEGYGKYAALF